MNVKAREGWTYFSLKRYSLLSCDTFSNKLGLIAEEAESLSEFEKSQVHYHSIFWVNNFHNTRCKNMLLIGFFAMNVPNKDFTSLCFSTTMLNEISHWHSPPLRGVSSPCETPFAVASWSSPSLWSCCCCNCRIIPSRMLDSGLASPTSLVCRLMICSITSPSPTKSSTTL